MRNGVSNLNLIPVKADKSPLVQWKSYQDNPLTEKEIDNWRARGVTNWAAICGYRGLECIDVDIKNVTSMSAEEFEDKLMKAIDADIKSKFVIQRTPSGGLHFLYRTKDVEGNQHLANESNKKPIIETRGVGGYVLVHPSDGYSLEQGNLEEMNILTSEERERLFETCRGFDNRPNPFLIIRKTEEGIPSEDKHVRMRRLIRRCQLQGIDITENYDDWVKVGFALVNEFGEEGRPYFHSLSESYRGYNPDECDRKYSNLLNSSREGTEQGIGITEIAKLAEENGLQVSENMDGVSKKYQMVQAYLKTKDLKFNEFITRTELAGERLDDRDLNSMYADLQENGIAASKEYVSTMIHSDRTPGYNPMKEMINKYRSEEYSDEIDRLLSSLILTEENPETAAELKWIIKKWLYQIPAIISDNKVPRLVLVLIGPSHIGKTHFFRHLLPSGYQSYYAESALNRGTDTKKLMCEKLIINNDEFGGLMRHNEMEEFKALSSADRFEERLPYARFNVTLYRKAILCGTSNRADVISDHTTGNTRIIPVEIERIDHEVFNSVDKTKLLAQIINEYEEHGREVTTLTYEEVDWMKNYSKSFMTENPEREAVLSCYEQGDDPKSSVEISNELQEKYPSQRLHSKKLATEMRNAGFSQKRIGGKRMWLVKSKIDVNPWMQN